MNIKLPSWLEGVIIAVFSGAIVAASDAYSRGDTDLAKLKGAAVGGAIIGLACWLKKSPVQKRTNQFDEYE